jgi:tetratricopeptide (TPR) repeat protein
MRQIKFILAFVSLIVSWPALGSTTLYSFERGDEAFRKRVEPERAKEALENYRALIQERPQDVEAAWRFSMASYFVGMRIAPQSDRAKIFSEGRDVGQKAVALRSDCAPCHFWTAINMALYGKEVGIFKTLFTLAEIREHLKKALEADPKYANAGAQRLLGAVEENLPGILGGSDVRALEYYQDALRVSPEEPLNYLFLVRLLFKQNRNQDDAIHLAQKGIQIAILDPGRIESIEAQSELRELLNKYASRSN